MFRYAKIGASLFLLLGITSSFGAILSNNNPLLSLGMALGMAGTLITLNVKEK
jgi:hypothetical protein